MLQCQLDLYININEKLTRELMATHWRITRLMVDDGAGRGPIEGRAFTVTLRSCRVHR